MRYLLTLLFITLVLIVNSSVATGSLTIASQVLDSTVRPEGETTVFLTLTNPSTTTAVRNIKLYILPGPHITPSSTYLEMGSLDATASQQTSLTVQVSSAATSMTSYITVKATYYTDSTQYQTTVNIPITIKRIPVLQVAEVQYIPSLIEPGNRVNLNFNLKNVGDSPAKDVKVVLNQTTQKFIVEGSPEAFINFIEPKESASVSFNLVIDPSVDIGIYSIPISLTYFDETKTTNYSATKYIGLTVSGKYNFIVIPSQSVVAPGKKGTVDLEVANAGTQEALYLTVKILSSYPIEVIQPTRYVGNLKSDDYDIQEFTFKVDERASPGTYPLKLELTYKDPYGKTYNETSQVDIVVSSTKEFAASDGKGLSPATIVITILVLGAIIYFGYKKFRKKK